MPKGWLIRCAAGLGMSSVVYLGVVQLHLQVHNLQPPHSVGPSAAAWRLNSTDGASCRQNCTVGMGQADHQQLVLLL